MISNGFAIVDMFSFNLLSEDAVTSFNVVVPSIETVLEEFPIVIVLAVA